MCASMPAWARFSIGRFIDSSFAEGLRSRMLSAHNHTKPVPQRHNGDPLTSLSDFGLPVAAEHDSLKSTMTDRGYIELGQFRQQQEPG